MNALEFGSNGFRVGSMLDFGLCCYGFSGVVGEQSRGRAAGFASVRRSALRVDCAALLGLVAPSRNSLRSLRSLRSDNRDESVDEARCARSHEPCAA
ncbi:hypothetical protein, partial [Methylibium sp.]|uniref:hypothetical protein n=1 Tax=Methylibium sp. TaxID=2067992 RepID=UPI0025E05A4B